ncbi:hypothetical protein [Sphingobacterium paludis]|uniref:Uncharacterized protein n=1 Tax=Sphingobacterium paludis TaxID=1476465 RepID=A0A4R7D2W3_9SPHI|nr:hypothetical protein [Sphingobacterium paludis]TDS14767.1 hypothetical protein B0I21_103266 [Sphingobacterium paludis]
MNGQTISKRMLQVVISGGILVLFFMVAVAAFKDGVYTFAFIAVTWAIGCSTMTFFLIGRRTGQE